MELDMTATAKAGEIAWGSRQNATDAILTPQLAATTRLWAGGGYYPHLAGSLSILVLPRDPRSGTNSSGTAHDSPQTVTAPGRSLSLQAPPDTSHLRVPYPPLIPAQVSKWALIGLNLAPSFLGRGQTVDSRGNGEL